jgi:hypothetical protein
MDRAASRVSTVAAVSPRSCDPPRQRLQDRDGDAAAGQRLGHLQSDVAADDDHGLDAVSVKEVVEGQRVAHAVQHMYPVFRSEFG